MLNKNYNEKTRFDKEYSILFPIIYKVSYRITGDQAISEDLCHEAFIKYYERHESLPDIDQVKYWLIRVVKNMSLNYEKRKSREKNAINKLNILNLQKRI